MFNIIKKIYSSYLKLCQKAFMFGYNLDMKYNKKFSTNIENIKQKKKQTSNKIIEIKNILYNIIDKPLVIIGLLSDFITIPVLIAIAITTLINLGNRNMYISLLMIYALFHGITLTIEFIKERLKYLVN